jgi:hypothetical protein
VIAVVKINESKSYIFTLKTAIYAKKRLHYDMLFKVIANVSPKFRNFTPKIANFTPKIANFTLKIANLSPKIVVAKLTPAPAEYVTTAAKNQP